MTFLNKVEISIISVFVKSRLPISEYDTLLITSLYYKTMILCTCSFASIKILAPLPGIDLFLFLPILIKNNLGFNLDFYFIYLWVCFLRWMRRARTHDITLFNPEIERTLRSQIKKKVLAMADRQHDAQPRTLKDYAWPVVNDNYSGIRH